MADEDGKGGAAPESTGARIGLDVEVSAADAQAKASTSAAAAAAVSAEPSISTLDTKQRTQSAANAAVAVETDQDGDDAGTKMNPHVSHAFHHGPADQYSGGVAGGASTSARRPLPMSLPARSSTGFTPINNYPRHDDVLPNNGSHNNHNAAPTLPPIGSFSSLPPPQTQSQPRSHTPQHHAQAPRQRTSLPTARPTSSSTTTTNGPLPFYPGHSEGRPLPSNYGINPREMAQYALLPPEPKAFQRQAPKKEIKRRTKTGCMTCRKRRIKCDEAHPSCNNCKKSKRECLGYDPVFREHNPETAPNNNKLRSSPAPSSPSSRGPTTPNSHPETLAAPRRETPNAPETASRPLPTAASYIAPDAAREPGDQYKVVIDNLLYPIPLPSDNYRNVAQDFRPPVRIKSEPTETSRSGTFFDPVTAAVSERKGVSPATDFSSNGHSTLQSFEERRFRLPGVMRVGDLINGFGTSAPQLESVQSDETYQEVVKVYHEMYAPGLASLFESSWFYFTDNGKMSFPQTGNTAGHVAAFLKLIKGANIQDQDFMAHCSVVELRLVWELAKLAANAAPDKADNRMRATLPPENDAVEVKNRFSIVDALLGGDFLPWNPLTPPAKDANPHREREFDFWHQLGEYLRWTADKDQAEEEKRRRDTIDRMRWLLDGRENRDVLYSILVLRHYSPRFDMVEAMKAKYHLPEEDAKNRVVVAAKFIEQQAQINGGTTNVIRRVCDIAARLFVNPRR